jgi:hypothetical protein
MLDFLKKILHDSPILLLLSLNDRLKILERVVIIMPKKLLGKEKPTYRKKGMKILSEYIAINLTLHF